MAARKHHHVSQFYLEGFTSPVAGYRRPMLFVIDIKDKRPFLASPRDVAFKEDFHRIEIDGYAPDALESSFAIFEGGASQALKHIISTRSIQNADDRAYLFNLMALFGVKTPRRRETIRQVTEQLVKLIFSTASATPKRWAAEIQKAKVAGVIGPDTDEAKLLRFRAEQYNITMPTNVHLNLELESLDAVLPFLFQRKWVLLRAPPGQTGFITSDDPVCLMWSDPSRRGNFKGPGHGVRGTLIIFSICNELALMGTFEGAERERDVSAVELAQINAAIALHGERQIYARDSNFTYQMTHNEKIMLGDEFLGDQESLV
jgi:Protein of unknown function (DUF4238)